MAVMAFKEEANEVKQNNVIQLNDNVGVTN
jgi:hypothetical protein